MKNKKNIAIIIIVAVFAVILIGAYILYGQLSAENDAPKVQETDEKAEISSENGEKEDFKAPDFTVYDYDGNQVKLSDFKGKPVVVSFWASWCGACKTGMPAIEKAFSEYGEEIQFMMINLSGGSDTEKAAKEFIEESGYTFPVFFDNDNDAAYTYGTTSIPVTYFVDADGTLITYGIGALDEETLLKAIGMIQ